MKGVIALLYFAAIGWAISHYELDKQAAEAARKALHEFMRQSAVISFDVYEQRYGLPPGAQPQRPLPLAPATITAHECPPRHADGPPCSGPPLCGHPSHMAVTDG